jgi:hypothetical protein
VERPRRWLLAGGRSARLRLTPAAGVPTAKSKWGDAGGVAGFRGSTFAALEVSRSRPSAAGRAWSRPGKREGGRTPNLPRAPGRKRRRPTPERPRTGASLGFPSWSGCQTQHLTRAGPEQVTPGSPSLRSGWKPSTHAGSRAARKRFGNTESRTGRGSSPSKRASDAGTGGTLTSLPLPTPPAYPLRSVHTFRACADARRSTLIGGRAAPAPSFLRAPAALDGSLEKPLRHLRAALDTEPLGLPVELVLGLLPCDGRHLVTPFRISASPGAYPSGASANWVSCTPRAREGRAFFYSGGCARGGSGEAWGAPARPRRSRPPKWAPGGV